MTTSLIPLTFKYDFENDIELDVYLPTLKSDTSSISGRIHSPVVIWFHGGGLIMGGKADMIEYPLDMLLPQGIIVISANYRMLLPCSGQAIIDDVKILFRYLSSPSSELTDALATKGISLDHTRMATYGISSGAYPARVAATDPTISPRPKAFVGVAGMGGDLLLDHWIQPKAGKDIIPIPESTIREVEKILETGGDQVYTDLHMVGTLPPDLAVRISLFKTLYNIGTILDYVLGEKGISARIRSLPHNQRLAAIPREKRHLLLPITSDTCPAMVVHGAADKQVPFDEGRKTWDDLGEMGVERMHEWVEGAGHAVADPARMGMEKKDWEMVFERVIGWLVERLRR